MVINMKNLKEFCTTVLNGLTEFYGDGVKITLQEINKNNGVKLNGLVLFKEPINISPTIYLEGFYEEYKKGKSIAQVILEIQKMYEKFKKECPINMDFFKDFEKVKKRICSKLIHFEKNKELLQTIPHVPFLDLAIVFYFSMENELIGRGTVLIGQNHVDLWGVSIEELHQVASENNEILYPEELINMGDLLQEFCDDFLEEQINDLLQQDLEEEEAKEQAEEALEGFLSEAREEDMQLPMLILSNSIRQYGAISMAYPKVLQRIANEKNSNFYILPSSVHEIILVPELGQTERGLKEIVSEVNQTQVAPDEYLSDTIYYYDRKKDVISIVC